MKNHLNKTPSQGFLFFVKNGYFKKRMKEINYNKKISKKNK